MDMMDDKRRVLIIDDTPENIQVLLAALQGRYTVTAANSGSKGLELANSHPPPDLILLDIMMPEMDGYEVCRRLKDDPNTQNIPIIFITAMREDEDEEKGLQLGAIDYITKPIKPSLVRVRVENHIQLHLLQQQLQQQNHQLQEAAKLRDDIERITRHDLKSPLSVILAYPQLIEMDGNLNSSQLDGLNEIVIAARRILDMINRSLDLYKMEEGRYQLRPERVVLQSVISGVIKECSVIASQLSVRIECDLDSVYGGIWGESLLCHTMLVNLIKNAIEASPSGAVVRVRAESSADKCHIFVHNFGAVPEQIRENFFDKFTSCNKATGTGLGTYSARLCAEVQGGEIKMETNDQQGTTVIVTLTRAEE